jgi:excisionase family DNA binding protein
MQNEILTMTQAADYARVGRQAVYRAIKSGRLKAKLVNKRYQIATDDIDSYRANKYSREGNYDIAGGYYSVTHVCKALSDTLKIAYPMNRLYYLLRTGILKGNKKGGIWVIEKEAAMALYEAESGRDKNQTRFA